MTIYNYLQHVFQIPLSIDKYGYVYEIVNDLFMFYIISSVFFYYTYIFLELIIFDIETFNELRAANIYYAILLITAYSIFLYFTGVAIWLYILIVNSALITVIFTKDYKYDVQFFDNFN